MAKGLPEFTIYYKNVNGLNAKYKQLVDEINCTDYNIIALIETSFKDDRKFLRQLGNIYHVF